MDLVGFLGLMEPMEWLTISLVLFAGAQLRIQARQERQRRLERQWDADEAADRAFHYAWAEHFRMEGVSDRLDQDDLIEMAVLGVLKPEDVLPHDWSELTRSLASLGREAGFLGGVAASLCHDVERAVAMFVSSVHAFSRRAPSDLSSAVMVEWLRANHGPELEPWERRVKSQVQELSLLLWDAASLTPRAHTDRVLDFGDGLKSRFAQSAVEALEARAVYHSKLTESPDSGSGDSRSSESATKAMADLPS